jgi:hypothetical protein
LSSLPDVIQFRDVWLFKGVKVVNKAILNGSNTLKIVFWDMLPFQIVIITDQHGVMSQNTLNFIDKAV